MNPRAPSELLSPFSVAFWMGGGLVALLLLTSKKKTPIDTVQGLPPYQGPRTADPTSDALVGTKAKTPRARRPKEKPPEPGLVRGAYLWTTPEASEFSRDLARAADSTWMHSLAERGIPHPYGDKPDVAFLMSPKGQRALRYLQEHQVNLGSPWNDRFWSLREKVEKNRIAGAPPLVAGASGEVLIGLTDSERARRWDEMAEGCEIDAKKLKPKDRAGLLELAKDYRERARQWRAGTRDQ